PHDPGDHPHLRRHGGPLEPPGGPPLLRHRSPDPLRLKGGRAVTFSQRFLKSRQAAFGLGILGLLALASLLGPLFSPYDPYASQLSEAFLPPGTSHPMGTDYLGRDIATRLMVGGRLSLSIGLLAVAI